MKFNCFFESHRYKHSILSTSRNAQPLVASNVAWRPKKQQSILCENSRQQPLLVMDSDPYAFTYFTFIIIIFLELSGQSLQNKLGNPLSSRSSIHCSILDLRIAWYSESDNHDTFICIATTWLTLDLYHQLKLCGFRYKYTIYNEIFIYRWHLVWANKP